MNVFARSRACANGAGMLHLGVNVRGFIPGCLQTRPLPSAQTYTVDRYSMRAPVRTLDIAKLFTYDGDIVQTSLLSRDVCAAIPVIHDVKPTAETDSTYLKTPMANLTRLFLKRGRAGNEDGGEDSEREGGR